MGPGPRFSIQLFCGIEFGFRYSKWPHDHSIYIFILCFQMYIGLGDDYVTSELKK